MYIPYFRLGCQLEINAQRTSAYLNNLSPVCGTSTFRGTHNMSCKCPPLYWTIPENSSTTYTITTKALTTNVALLTTSKAHGFAVSDFVTVSGVDATFNGTFVVTAVPTTTQFSNAKVTANVVSVASGGTAYVPIQSSSYTTPAGDGMPWYDADIPESAQFLGFLISDVVMNSVSTRSINTRISSSGGGVLGPTRNKERRYDFTVLMFGCNELALEYGYRFLADALNAGGCDSDCSTCDAEYRDSCPDVSGSPPSYSNMQKGRWILKNIASVDGPSWDTSPVAGMACNVRAVKFSLVSELPWKFKCPVMECQDVALAGIPAWDGSCSNITNVMCTQAYAYCSVTEPLILGETGLIISIKAGSVDLQHLDIAIIPDKFGYEANPATAPVNYVSLTPCDNIHIPLIPANSTFVYDTSIEQVTLIMPGGDTVEGSSLISTNEGTPPTFPTLRCGTFAIRVSVSECSVIGSPTVTIQSVHREI